MVIHFQFVRYCPLDELVSSKLSTRYKGSLFVGKWKERDTNYRAKELRLIHFYLNLYKSIT